MIKVTNKRLFGIAAYVLSWIIVLYIVLYVGIGSLLLYYISYSYDSVQRGETINEVRSELSWFSEREISFDDIPRMYRESVNKAQSHRVFVYGILFDALTFIVIYDSAEKVYLRIPIYEF